MVGLNDGAVGSQKNVTARGILVYVLELNGSHRTLGGRR